MVLAFTSYSRSRLASPRLSSGLPFKSDQGASSIACNALRIAADAICSVVPKNRPQVGQQTDSQTRLGILGGRNKCNCCSACAPRPITADGVRDGKQRLPDIGVTILNFGRQVWLNDISGKFCGPRLNEAVNSRAVRGMNSSSIRFHLFAWLNRSSRG